jgi:hypothetical protein
VQQIRSDFVVNSRRLCGDCAGRRECAAIVHRDYAAIVQRSHSKFAANLAKSRELCIEITGIVQRLCSDCAAIVRSDYAAIVQRSHSKFAAID